MKRNVVTAFAMLVFVCLYGVVLYADPVDSTGVVVPSTPLPDTTVILPNPPCPLPPGLCGWSSTSTSTDTSDTSGIWPWNDPIP